MNPKCLFFLVLCLSIFNSHHGYCSEPHRVVSLEAQALAEMAKLDYKKIHSLLDESCLSVGLTKDVLDQINLLKEVLIRLNQYLGEKDSPNVKMNDTPLLSDRLATLVARNPKLIETLYILTSKRPEARNHLIQRDLFYFAIEEEQNNSIRTLISLGADVNKSVYFSLREGFRPLHAAAESGKSSTVKLLLEAGADPNAIYFDFGTPIETPLTLAEKREDKEIEGQKIKRILLENKADPKLLESIGEFFEAASTGDVEKMKSFLKFLPLNVKEAKDGNTALHLAAKNNQLKVVEFLVGQGALLNGLNDAGKSPYQLAIEAEHPEVAIYLLSKGARRVVQGPFGLGFEHYPDY